MLVTSNCKGDQNYMKYKIVSDSTSNLQTLPGSIEYKTVPLKILADGKEFVSGRFGRTLGSVQTIGFQVGE